MLHRLLRFSQIKIKGGEICVNLCESVVKKIRTTDNADSHRLKSRKKNAPKINKIKIILFSFIVRKVKYNEGIE